MRTKPKLPARKPRKRLIDIIEQRQPYDAAKTERTNRRAREAADKLLREMDEFVRNADRKGH